MFSFYTDSQTWQAIKAPFNPFSPSHEDFPICNELHLPDDQICSFYQYLFFFLSLSLLQARFGVAGKLGAIEGR